MTGGGLGLWIVPLAVLGGAVRVSTPFLFVSLGECITERGGRINLGLEGTFVMGAMSGYAVSYLSGSPWLGVLAAGVVGIFMGLLHAAICSLQRVNDIAVGIALMLFGVGLADYLGKPFIQPAAPQLPSISFGWWAGSPDIENALKMRAFRAMASMNWWKRWPASGRRRRASSASAARSSPRAAARCAATNFPVCRKNRCATPASAK
jgi:general nucleoside transport system permease protein